MKPNKIALRVLQVVSLFFGISALFFALYGHKIPEIEAIMNTIENKNMIFLFQIYSLYTGVVLAVLGVVFGSIAEILEQLHEIKINIANSRK